jgi:hypothetical protein
MRKVGGKMLTKKILISLFTIVILVMVASAETWAYFDNTKSATGNIIKAGSIDLAVTNYYYKHPIIVPMIADNAVPGDTDVGLRDNSFYFHNTGSINGALYASVVPTIGDNSILSKYLVITATDTPIPMPSEHTVILWNKGPVDKQILGNLNAYPAEGKTFYFRYSFPDSGLPQNDAQGEAFKFDCVFELRQN